MIWTRRENNKNSLSSFQNHDYFLSRPAAWDEAASENMCEVYGGYLVEINDQDEWKFVVNLLNNNSVSHWTVIGASDMETEGAWTFVHSGLLATYLNWAPGQPQNYAHKDCLYISYTDPSHRQMHDGTCQQDSVQRYVCEIE